MIANWARQADREHRDGSETRGGSSILACWSRRINPVDSQRLAIVRHSSCHLSPQQTFPLAAKFNHRKYFELLAFIDADPVSKSWFSSSSIGPPQFSSISPWR
jgi:hypothetical protein